MFKLIERFFPNHAWDERTDEQRTCQVCGRVEHYEETDGWVAGSWRLLRAGDNRAHVGSAKDQSPAIHVLDDETTQPKPTSLA